MPEVRHIASSGSRNEETPSLQLPDQAASVSYQPPSRHEQIIHRYVCMFPNHCSNLFVHYCRCRRHRIRVFQSEHDPPAAPDRLGGPSSSPVSKQALYSTFQSFGACTPLHIIPFLPQHICSQRAHSRDPHSHPHRDDRSPRAPPHSVPRQQRQRHGRVADFKATSTTTLPHPRFAARPTKPSRATSQQPWPKRAFTTCSRRRSSTMP